MLDMTISIWENAIRITARDVSAHQSEFLTWINKCSERELAAGAV